MSDNEQQARQSDQRQDPGRSGQPVPPPRPRILDPHAPANMVGRMTAPAAGPSGSPVPSSPVPSSPVPSSPVPAAGLSASPLPPAPSGPMPSGPAPSPAEVEALDLASVASPLGVGDGDGDIADLTAERALAAVDPLTRRPRTSSRVLCVVVAVVCFAAAAGVWWLGVRTEYGQAYDDLAASSFAGHVPGWLVAVLHVFTAPFPIAALQGAHSSSYLVFGVSALLAVAAVAVAAARQRWWLLGQLAVFAAVCFGLRFLKDVLPRPFIIHTLVGGTANSAPSGHTMLAFACGLMLLMAVPRAWRAAAAVVAALWSVVVGLSVVVGGWHRPSDVAMALLLVGGVAALVLAFSRASGMDAPGTRASSAGVQIVGTVMLTGGLMALLYGVYVVWQVVPGLSVSAEWAQVGAVGSACVLVAACASLVAGLVMAMRQLTASPLTKLGLIGGPPAPPEGRRHERAV